MALAAGKYRGPYLVTSQGKLPTDPITAEREWTYRTAPPEAGRVSSTAKGKNMEGMPYADIVGDPQIGVTDRPLPQLVPIALPLDDLDYWRRRVALQGLMPWSRYDVLGLDREFRESNLKVTLAKMRWAIEMFRLDTGAWPAGLADVLASSAPSYGLNKLGAKVAIEPNRYRGPYLKTLTGSLPVDAVTNHTAWSYRKTPPQVGHVSSGASGKRIDEPPYSDW